MVRCAGEEKSDEARRGAYGSNMLGLQELYAISPTAGQGMLLCNLFGGGYGRAFVQISSLSAGGM